MFIFLLVCSWQLTLEPCRVPALCAVRNPYVTLFFFFRPEYIAFRILVFQPVIELMPLAVEVWSLNHWISREVQNSMYNFIVDPLYLQSKSECSANYGLCSTLVDLLKISMYITRSKQFKLMSFKCQLYLW